jgi:hypothetical protein
MPVKVRDIREKDKNMESKSLYDENERQTKDADDLDGEVAQVLEPIFSKWVKEGFKIREIESVMRSVCMDLALDALLGLTSREGIKARTEDTQSLPRCGVCQGWGYKEVKDEEGNFSHQAECSACGGWGCR